MSKIAEHFDNIAKDYDSYKKNNSFYYSNLKNLLARLIPKNSKVMEIGCGTGDILAHLEPKSGYGVDISRNMVRLAKSKYKQLDNLTFSTTYPDGLYDYVFMADVVEHLDNPLRVFEAAYKHLRKKGIFVITMANPIWEPLLMFWEKMGWKMPEGYHKRLGYKEIVKMVRTTGKYKTRHIYELLIPVNIFFLTKFVNKFLFKYFERFSFIECLIFTKL